MAQKLLDFKACLAFALFQIFVWMFFGQTLLAQAPPGYTLCAGENQTFTLPAKSHIAYGAMNRFKSDLHAVH